MTPPMWKPRRAPRERRTAGIRPGWAGERCPPGSRVAFNSRKGRVEGKVVELRLRDAVVAGGADGRWRVSYGMLDVLERSGNTTSLSEVFQHATTVLKQFQEQGVLDAAWHVEFDLAPKRAGQCLYGQQRIQLVSCPRR